MASIKYVTLACVNPKKIDLDTQEKGNKQNILPNWMYFDNVTWCNFIPG